MKKKIKNEELYSRREFFKKAVKTALPIIATVVLVSNPVASKQLFPLGGFWWPMHGCNIR